MPMDDQRFISRGFPAPPLPEDFPVRLGRLEDRSGLPLEEFSRRWLVPEASGYGVAMWRARPPHASCAPSWSGPAQWTAAWR